MSNSTQRPKPSLIGKADILFSSNRYLSVKPQAPAGTSVPLGYRTSRSGLQSQPPDFVWAINLSDTCCQLSNMSLVEADGIEPTTSCLQSTRSPN